MERNVTRRMILGLLLGLIFPWKARVGRRRPRLTKSHWQAQHLAGIERGLRIAEQSLATVELRDLAMLREQKQVLERILAKLRNNEKT